MDHERIIYILEYLTKYTSKKKKATIRDIQAYLSDHDIRTPSVLTIRRDLDRLSELSFCDVQNETGAHNTKYYYIVQKNFTFNEIRFIVDSISINQFLSYDQKRTLIKKFEGQLPKDEIKQLTSRISLKNQLRHSADLLENLEKVHQTISENRKINFEYGKFDTRKQMRYYEKRREMIPCKVIYFNERFYLKCVDETTQKPRTYRIDRMRNIKKGAPANCKPVLPKQEGGIVLDMFDPEYYAHVWLRIRKFLLDDMLEQFQDIPILEEPEHPDYVKIRIHVGISKGFYKWVMKYGENMEILSPEPIRQDFTKMIRKVWELYQNQNQN